MGVDQYRVCELYAAGPEAAGSGSGYRLGDRLVLTARHVIASALAGPGGRVLVRPVGESSWLSARVEWENADSDAALIAVEEEGWRAPAGESVLRWGEVVGADPVPCAAVGFPWASARPDRMRDTAHAYGQLAPLGQLRQGRLDFDVASASPSAREGGSPWAGMSGAGVIADSHLVGVITVDPARYAGRLVAVPVSRMLGDPGFRDRLAAHGVPTEVAPVGAGWYLRLSGRQAVSLAINRQFLVTQETQGIGKVWGNWISPENRDALKGDKDAPLPEFNVEKAKQLLAQAGFPNGFEFEWFVAFPPYFDMGERILTDLRAVGIRGKIQVLEGPAFRSKVGQGRKGYPGNKSIVQNIDPRSGGAKANLGVYAVCGSPASFVCEPQVEALWTKHQASVDPVERERLVKAIQRVLLDEYYFVPIYWNPFVAAVGPRVLPEGDGFHRYWDTLHAPYPWPWEVWEVKADRS